MTQGKASAQSLACSWSFINVRYYYLLTFKIRRGDGAFRVPISSFLVPIGTRPSFEDGVGVRCAPGKAAPPTHSKLLTLLAAVGLHAPTGHRPVPRQQVLRFICQTRPVPRPSPATSFLMTSVGGRGRAPLRCLPPHSPFRSTVAGNRDSAIPPKAAAAGSPPRHGLP